MTDRVPAHQIAYARLRDMVLFGDLAPGAAVTIEGLVAELDLGMTPVREAIRRLLAEGALQMQGNRRVCVPKLTEAALEDLGYARTAIETRLACQSLHYCDSDSVAKLAEIDRRLDAAIACGDIAAYLRSNHAFHFALYARAKSEVLEALAASLWLRLGPSLRVVCLGQGQGLMQDLPVMEAAPPDNHKRALAALEAGDAVALSEAISADIAQGVENIRLGLLSGLFE
ncbi:MAG: GntR family transcriptional regulator [Roseinatronobacter sp.]